MVISSSASPSPATSLTSGTLSSSSPGVQTSSSASCMIPGSTSLPVITSFAMKGDSVSPGPARVGGDVQPDILYPMDMEDMLNQIQDCNAIRYAAYRTASKLDLLRSALRVDAVKLGAVSNIFHQRGFSKTSKNKNRNVNSGVNQIMLDRTRAVDVITDIFFAAAKVRTYYSPILDVSACTETTLATVFKVYSSEQTNIIPVKVLKTFFVVLCDGRLKDKFSYLFREFADGEGNLIRLTRRGLTDLLQTLCLLPLFLGENSSFGLQLVSAAVSQCFAGHGSKEELLTETEFMEWLLREPQVIVWITTFYRLLSAKDVHHGKRCVNCKAKDITGLRYQCLRCIKYDLCQHCFFYGLSNRRHRLCHPMQEYCFQSTKKDATKALFQLLLNNLLYVGRSSRGFKSRKRYLPHDPQLEKQTSASAANSEPMKRNTRVDNPSMGKADENLDDNSSGFDSAISSNQECGVGYCESPVSRPQGHAPHGQNNHEAEFNSIIKHLEVNNAQMIDKLRAWERQQEGWPILKDGQNPNISLHQPLRNCQTIQQQLDKLKELMESVFRMDTEGRAGNLNMANPGVGIDAVDAKPSKQILKMRNSVVLELNSVNLDQPTFMVESTPMVGFGTNNNNQDGIKNKKLSRLVLDNNFSPIVYQTPRSPTLANKNANPTNSPQLTPANLADISESVEKFLNDLNGTDDESMGASVCADTSLTNVSLTDLTSLMARTGFQGQTMFDLNITDVLQNNRSDTNGGQDVVDDLENLLQKLESVFQSFSEDPMSSNLRKNPSVFNNDAVIIGQIVSEIGDQLETFAHHYRDGLAHHH